MKVSLSWLGEFVKIPKIPDIELAKKIAEHCFEVEKIQNSSDVEIGFSNVFAARVLEVAKHPNADRLRLVQLDLGSGKIIEPVVCGAWNFNAGDTVALALPGAKIPKNIHSDGHESFTLEKAKIRGIESQGMICSAFELGLVQIPEEKPEILILSADIKPGTDLSLHFSKDAGQRESGAVLDFSLPANRPDLHSHLGIAREFASIFGYKPTAKILELEKFAQALALPKNKKLGKLPVHIEEKNACRFYSAFRIKVAVSQSPQIIKQRLEALGIRPINNVVDITNYVMHEVGQPLHAFDAKYVDGAITLRYPQPGEKLVTIDHKERMLPPDALVIADQSKALALAGIMGGLESEISEHTAEIILEAANFEPTGIRRTSKKIGLRTEGSALWERNLRPEQARVGAARAIELLKKYAKAEVVAFSSTGKFETKTRTIPFTAAQVNQTLGTAYTSAQIKKILKQTPIKIIGGVSLLARIPYYRDDMENYADIADEIVRILGLNILKKEPIAVRRNGSLVDEEKPFYELKRAMAAAGLTEVQNYSFVSAEDIARFGLGSDSFVKITNPLSAENGFMKKHLLIPLLKNLAHNSKHESKLRLFEVGKGYHGYLQEKNLLTFVLLDKEAQEEKLLMDAKGIVAAVCKNYFQDQTYFKQNGKELIDIFINGDVLGNMGPVNTKITRAFSIDYPVVYAKIDLDKLFASAAPKIYKEYSRLPQRILDMSLVVSVDTTWEQVQGIVTGLGSGLLQAIDLFESPGLYPKNAVPKFHKELAEKGQKNLAFHLVFGAQNRTLKDSEILPIYDKMIEELKSKLGAAIR